MDQKKIDRINALAHKQKNEGLTEAEKSEQAELRAEYIAMFRANLRGQLNNMVIRRPDGTEERVADREKKTAKN